MTRGLHSKGAELACLVQFNLLVYNVSVASLEAIMLASDRLYVLFQSVRGYGIGNDNAAVVTLKSYVGSERNKAVTVNFLAVILNTARSVDVGIKNYSEVCMALDRCL